MKIKLLFTFAVLSFIFSAVNTVQAVPAAPKPLCEIKATVENAEFFEAKERENKRKMCSQMIPAKYQLRVMIDAVIAADPEMEASCQELYPVGKSQILTFLTGGRKIAFSFEKGQVIEGVIQYYGDECENGLYLREDFKIVNGEDANNYEEKGDYQISDDIIYPASDQHKSIWKKLVDWIKFLF